MNAHGRPPGRGERSWRYALRRHPLEAWLERDAALERRQVAHPPGFLRSAMPRLAVALAVWVTHSALDPEDSPAGLAAGFVAAYLVGTGVYAPLTRRRAFRRGWFAGRSAMVGSVLEASERDMGPAEWLAAELRRDLADSDAPPARHVPAHGAGASYGVAPPDGAGTAGRPPVRPSVGEWQHGDGTREPVHFVPTDRPGAYRPVTLDGEPVLLAEADELYLDTLAPGQSIDPAVADGQDGHP